MIVIDGKKTAQDIRAELADEVGAASTPLEVPAKTKAFNSIRRSKEAENA